MLRKNQINLLTITRPFLRLVIYLILLVFLSIFVSFPKIALAATSYFVDKYSVGGPCSDNNPGTITQPFCTVNKALTVVVPGDTVYFRAGVYPAFAITKSGTAGNLITFSGYTNENVTVDVASANGRLKDGIYTNRIVYVEISNFEVIHAKGQFKAGIHINAGGNIIIRNNRTHDNSGSNNLIDGILVYDSSNNQIIGNTSYANNFSGIRIGSASIPASGNTIVGNTVYSNTALGGDTDGIHVDGATTNTLIKDNIVHDNSDDGIDTWTSHNNIVEGNISYNHNGIGDGNGFKMGGQDTGGDNIVRFNISYNNKLNGFDSNGSGGNVYYHNVAYNNGNYGFEDGWRNVQPGCPNTPACFGTFINNIGYNNNLANYSAGDQTKTSNYNLWLKTGIGANIRYKAILYSNLAAFTAASGGLDANSIEADPQFVSPTTFDFHLQATSPAIDSGDPANPAGVTVCGTRVDVGRFEFCP